MLRYHKQVGEADPIFDVMAVMLENISTITMTSRTTVYAVYRTSQIVATLPNLYDQKKARNQYTCFNIFLYALWI